MVVRRNRSLNCSKVNWAACPVGDKLGSKIVANGRDHAGGCVRRWL